MPDTERVQRAANVMRAMTDDDADEVVTWPQCAQAALDASGYPADLARALEALSEIANCQPAPYEPDSGQGSPWYQMAMFAKTRARQAIAELSPEEQDN